MLTKRTQWRFLAPLLALSMGGCIGLEQRTGPSPVIDGAAAYSASDNKAILLSALARDAGFRPGEPVDYYQVAEAGFNYVDDQCRSYFDELFFLNRGREQAKSGISAAGQTTAAILGVTGRPLQRWRLLRRRSAWHPPRRTLSRAHTSTRFLQRPLKALSKDVKPPSATG